MREVNLHGWMLRRVWFGLSAESLCAPRTAVRAGSGLKDGGGSGVGVRTIFVVASICCPWR